MPADFRKDVLDSGLTLVMERHPGFRGTSLGVWVRVGSAYESARENGISHFIEHMVFKGTESRTPVQIVSALEALGGELNAFTEREYTCYHASLLNEHIDQGLSILSDILLHPTFPAQEIEREKKVLIQEMAMADETPEDLVLTVLFKTVWAKEAMGMPILGSRKAVAGLSRRHLRKYFSQYYRPENMVIAVSGDISFDDVRAKVERHFRFTGERRQRALAFPKERAVFQSRRRAQVMDTEQLHLMLGFESVGLRDPQRFEALMLSYYLGGGMSSRLFQEIREKAALAYTVECDAIPYCDEGLLTIYVATSHRSLRRCLGIIGREVERLVEKPLPEGDLEAIKGQIRGILLMSADHMESRQEAIGRNELVFGRHVPLEESLAAIEAVTPSSLQRFAARTFRKESEASVTLARTRFKPNELSVFRV